MGSRSEHQRGTRHRGTIAAVLGATLISVVACSSGRVVNTGEAPPVPPTDATAPTSPVRTSNDGLANAFDYSAQPDGRTAYYFTSPSKRWVCAIIPREEAGCQAATGSTIPITGRPDTVLDAQGASTAPNAIQIDRLADAVFASVEAPGFALVPGPAVELPFGKVLTVAGFQCNVQEATGISCLSELSGKGFTFSADGYSLQYTDLPR